GCFRLHLWSYPRAFCCTGPMGAIGTRLSLRPLLDGGQTIGQTSGETRRENANVYLKGPGAGAQLRPRPGRPARQRFDFLAFFFFLGYFFGAFLAFFADFFPAFLPDFLAFFFLAGETFLATFLAAFLTFLTTVLAASVVVVAAAATASVICSITGLSSSMSSPRVERESQR